MTFDPEPERKRIPRAVIGAATCASAVVTLLAVLQSVQPSWAADHIDGPATTADPTADLTDSFAFMSPENPGRLVASMTVHPAAPLQARFSDAVQYVIRVRRVRPNQDAGARTLQVEDDELRLVCVADGSSTQKVRCGIEGACAAGAQDACVATEVELGQSSRADGPLRVFAGVRADPFFLDIPGAKATLVGGALQFTGDNSALSVANVLAIVAEIDTAALGLPAQGALYGVTVETRQRPVAAEVTQ